MLNERQRLEKLIGAALIQIIEERPLYYLMLKRIPKIFRNNLKGHCALGIDESTGLLSFLFNSQSLVKASVDEIKVLLEHLLLHTLLPHHHQHRFEEGKSFHLACDLIINQSISQIKASPKLYANGFSIFGNILTPARLNGLFSFDSLSIENSSVFEVWPIIKDKKHVLNLESYDTIDETDFYIQNFLPINKWLAKDFNNERLLQNQVKRSVVCAVSELARMGRGPGDLPMFLSKRINEILEESAEDYSSLLMRFAGQSIKKINKRSWSKVNRKYPHQIRGKFLKNEKTPKLLVVMDTSGSMWEDSLLNKIVSEIKKIREICPDIWIVGGDVVEQFRFYVGDGLDLNKLTLTGGGGTDLQFGFDAAKELGVDGTIVLTDGCIPEFSNHDINTAFVIVPCGIAVEGFENIFLV